ncbi:MAG: SDR family oxidoreductase [Myxococcales bacterium]|nr:SDR family oxidoreductase [Myxococcales bacterium]
MRQFQDRVVAITGAASGIGRALAVDLARRGASLALSDVDEVGLAETARLASGPRVTTRRLDVADRTAVFAWAEEVAHEHGRVHVIVNNAGVALSATLANTPIADFEWLMGINFWGVVHGTQAFLPHLLRAEEGHVVNLSSVFGLIAVPSQGAYNASKFAVRGFTEALRQELADTKVRVTCVHPGGVRTNIARRGRILEDEQGQALTAEAAARDFEKVARTSPEDAAAEILAAMQAGAPRALVGLDAKIIDRMARLLPDSYDRVVRAFATRTKKSLRGS